MQARCFAYILFVAAITLFLFLNLNIKTDIQDFFFDQGSNSNKIINQKLSSGAASKRYFLRINVDDKEPGSKVDPEFVTSFKQILHSHPNVSDINSEDLSLDTLSELLSFYSSHAPNLFSTASENAFLTTLSRDAIDARAKAVKELITGPDPGLAKVILTNDPLLLSLPWLRDAGTAFSHEEPAQEQHHILIVATDVIGTDTATHEELMAFFDRTFREISLEFETSHSLEYTGVPVFSVTIKDLVSSDISTVSLLSTFFLVLVFLFAFRSLRTLTLIALLLYSSIVIAIFVTQLVFSGIHGLTLALGITLAGICIDYLIHGVMHSRSGVLQQRVASVNKIWPALILGGTTTSLGYLALGVSGFPGLQQISVFAVVCIVSSLLITRFILPGLTHFFQLSFSPTIKPTALLKALNQVGVHPVVLLAILFLLFAGSSGIHIQTDLESLTPDISTLKDRDRSIRSGIVSFEPGRFVMTKAENWETALIASDQVHAQLTQLLESGGIDTFSTSFPWIASRETQVKNLQTWNNSLTDELKNSWEKALLSQGVNAIELKRKSLDENSILTMEQLRSSAIWPLVSSHFVESGTLHAVITFLGKHDASAVRKAISQISGAEYFSHRSNIQAVGLEYQQRAFLLLLGGIAAIYFLLSIRYRSVLYAALVLSPAASAIAITLFILNLLAAPINVMHMLGLLLVAALSVDYAIFYFENRSGHRENTFQAVTMSALTTVVSFACLSAAQNPALQALAYTVAPGVVTGYLLVAILVKPDNRGKHSFNAKESVP